MITVRVTPAKDVMAAIRTEIRTSGRRMRVEFQRTAAKASSALLKRVRDDEPAMPKLPFLWSHNPAKQSRARRWYFYWMVPPTGGSGRYERTGALLDAYKVRINLEDDDGLLVLENSAQGAEYVIGDRQVPSHEMSGWRTIDDAALEFSDVLTDHLIDTWFAVTEAER